MTFSNITLAAATLCAGLMAGLFYSYSCSVMPGLKRVSDKEFIAAMQSINRVIQNPVFFLSFFGSVLLLPLCAYLKYSSPATPVFWLILAAACLYIIGAFGVTIFGNIPLNNALDKFNLQGASAEMISQQRAAFEAKWNGLNTVRTVASVLSFLLMVVACMHQARNNAAGQ